MTKISENCEISCLNCGFQKAKLFFESRYGGFRGFCPDCKGNWPES